MSSDPEEYILQNFRQTFEPDENFDEREKCEDDIQSILNGEDTGFTDLIPYLKEWGNEFDKDFSEIIDFCNTMGEPEPLETIEEKHVNDKLSERKMFELERRVEKTGEDEMMATVDESIGLEEINRIQENIWIDHNKKCFLISDQVTLDGRVAGELQDTKKKFELMAVYQDKDNNYEFKHFGQGNPNKGLNKIDEFSQSFYQYKVVADDKQYLALSTEKLGTERCKLHGTHVSVNDYTTVGENRKLPVEEDILFVHHVEPAIEPMSLDELEAMQDKVSHEYLSQNMFGIYRHPDWFEDLFQAITSVNEDVDGYPGHLLIMAEPDTGTSTLLEASLQAFDEPQKEPFEGGASTVKGLTPSFAKEPPSEGLLLKSQRIAGVDEFFDLLKNTLEKGGSGNRQDAFTSLKSLLEHKKRRFESGNGSITGKMGAQVLAATNSIYGINNIIDAQEKLNSAVLSRFIQYEQLDSHIQYVRNHKRDLNCDYEEGLPDRDDEFVSLMDTLRDVVRVDVDGHKVGDIHDDLRSKVPAGFQDTFSRRHEHHIEVTVAGLAKVNYFKENRDSFEVQESDYKRAKELWEILISSWGDIPDNEMREMSAKARKGAATHAQRQVYEVIDNNVGITGDALSEEVDVDSLSWCKTKLLEVDLIVAKENEDGPTQYYPHWSDFAEKKFEQREEDVIY